MEKLVKVLEFPASALAWLGWVLFAGLLMLYYRLWLSASANELRKMSEELGKGRKTIKELRELEFTLKNRNDELHTINARLHADYIELRDQHSRLNVAFGKLGDQVSEMRKEMTELRTKYDEQFLQLMHERAKNGSL
jgi:predicted nuclease with TOPRIM domain